MSLFWKESGTKQVETRFDPKTLDNNLNQISAPVRRRAPKKPLGTVNCTVTVIAL